VGGSDTGCRRGLAREVEIDRPKKEFDLLWILLAATRERW